VSSTLTPEKLAQSLDALQHGNRIRAIRRDYKIDLKAGRRLVAELLDDPAVQSMPVMVLLRHQPLWGTQHAASAMRALHLPPNVIVSRLTPRQRGALVAHIDEHRKPMQARREAAARDLAA
jgi:hypothetical protein